MTTQLARSARWYARHGWHVFPLRPRTKEPFGGLGVYQATTDIDQITEWWARWPSANVGLHCGGSGLLAIDRDSYKDTYAGGGVLTAEDEQTLTSITGSGGTHLIYSVTDGRRWGNNKGTLPPGIDVRGWGGYIVLPPSVHPNGNLYQWEYGYRPDEIQPLPLPGLLCRLLDEGRKPERMPGPPDAIAVQSALKIVEATLQVLDIPVLKVQEYEKTGRLLTMKSCPFAPEDNRHADDKASFILIAPDGHISAGCLHERCRNRLATERIGGWQWLIHQRTQEYRTEEAAPERRSDSRHVVGAGRRRR